MTAKLRASSTAATLVVISLAIVALPVWATACRRIAAEPAPGIILISIDTLRADHLGAYGHTRPTSPFFDALARRGVLFENAIVQLPGTLPSHLSMLTGLYPGEHGVYPPDRVLSQRIPTLAELLRAAGFRTAGHTEGGYVDGQYGFRRGFDVFSSDSALVRQGEGFVKAPEAVKRTFGRGLEFLRSLRPSDRFFLFLHTYAVHDPYTPPEPYRSQFWPGAPPRGVFPPTGEAFAAFNRTPRPLPREAAAYYGALYDAQIRYVDDILRDFVTELSRLGLGDRTTLVITSDHGEELLEHGRLAHEQLYDECLHVPLLFVGPRAPAGRRVRRLVQSVDLAPTLLEIAGTPESKRPRMSGRSLLPLLAGADGPYPADAYAEAYGRQDRTLYRQTAGRLLQLIRSEPAREAAGTWVTRSIAFDHPGAELRFRAQAFQCTRPLEVSVDGRLLERAAVGVDGHWFRFALPERDGIRRVRLSSPSCTSPASLGESSDARCLSFRVEGLRLVMWQLFDLTRARRSGADLSRESPELVRELDRGLQGFAHKPVAPAARTALQGELAERLRALGYIQ